MFIDFHEVAERHGKHRVLGGRERIDAELVLEARDQHGKAERVETAIGQHEIVGERRQILPCSRAICAICSIMVNFTDMAAAYCLFTPARYIRATLTIKFTTSRGQRE